MKCCVPGCFDPCVSEETLYCQAHYEACQTEERVDHCVSDLLEGFRSGSTVKEYVAWIQRAIELLAAELERVGA